MVQFGIRGDIQLLGLKPPTAQWPHVRTRSLALDFPEGQDGPGSGPAARSSCRGHATLLGGKQATLVQRGQWKIVDED